MLIFSAMLLSCDSDSENMPIYERVITETGEVLKVRNDTLLILPDNIKLIENIIVSESSIEILRRYIDHRKGDVWCKAKVGEWGTNYNLSQDSTYLVRKDYYFQSIPAKRGYVAIPFVPKEASKEMGIYEKYDGKQYIGYEGGFDITPKFDNFGNCWTILYYIGYTLNGQSVSLYFPTSPEKLTWYYSLYKL